jgi:hypothetical protein
MGFEIRALCLLGRCSTTWVTNLAPLLLVYFSGRVLLFAGCWSQTTILLFMPSTKLGLQMWNPESSLFLEIVSWGHLEPWFSQSLCLPSIWHCRCVPPCLAKCCFPMYLFVKLFVFSHLDFNWTFECCYGMYLQNYLQYFLNWHSVYHFFLTLKYNVLGLFLEVFYLAVWEAVNFSSIARFSTILSCLNWLRLI